MRGPPPRFELIPDEIAQAPQQALTGQVAAALDPIGVASQSFRAFLVAPAPVPDLTGNTLKSRRLEPAHPGWAGGLRQSWTPGEISGQQRPGEFLRSGVAGYIRERDRLDRDGTSRGNGSRVAAPIRRLYFRVFNPTLQGEKFDPDGAYIKRRVPELARLPARLIHQPWSATPLERADRLGKSYPEPIVDHRKAHERALQAYAKLRAS